MRLLICSLLSLLSLACSAQFSTMVVAPGLTIPDGKTPWAVDHFADRVELVPIHHSPVKTNNHMAANMAGALTQSFFYKPKVTTELPGISAKTALHDLRPTFYYHIEEEDFDSLATFALVPAQVTKGHRIVSTVRYAQLTSKGKRDESLLECNVEHLEGGWVKLTPLEPLTPGEYALTPLFKDEKLLAMIVYDFSINQQAANAKDAIVASASQ